LVTSAPVPTETIPRRVPAPGCRAGWGEVVAGAQQREAGLLGEGVGEAVTEVQCGTVVFFGVPAPRAECSVCGVEVEVHDLDASVAQ
jgi:hypothetical protein